MQPTLRLAAAAAALGIAALASLPEAAADCARAEPGFLPRSGALVPPHPTLYVFVPHSTTADEGRVTVESTYNVDSEVETISRADAYDVVRVRVPLAEPGARFTVRWRYRDDLDTASRRAATYQVGDTAPNRARVVGVAHHKYEWTCSASDAIRLELEGTALAYRLAWDDGAATILPADDDVVWEGDDDPPRPGPTTTADLGRLNCMGHSIDPAALAAARGFTLFALFADGSELRIGRSAAQLGEQGLRLPLELLAAAGVAPAAPAPALAVIAIRPPGWSAALGALGGAIALAGAAIAGGLRRRARRTPGAARVGRGPESWRPR